MSERRYPAPDGLINEIRREKDGVIFLEGRCSQCGTSLDPKIWYLCSDSDLICEKCVRFHEGKAFCRKHFSEHIIEKRDCKVLFCLAMKIKVRRIKNTAVITSDDVSKSIMTLQIKGYVKKKTKFLILNSYKLTDTGISVLSSGSNVYGSDKDFEMMK